MRKLKQIRYKQIARHDYWRPVEPNPPAPRSVFGLTTATVSKSANRIGQTTAWAILSPGLITKSVFPRLMIFVFNSPRYPKSTVPGVLTTEIPYRAAKPERGRT